MNLPWMKFHTRDWLDNKELRRCSPVSRAVLLDLMCLAHEGTPAGYLTDKLGPLTDEYMAGRCMLPKDQFRDALQELIRCLRVSQSESGPLFIERMVVDSGQHAASTAYGKQGGNPGLKGGVNPPVNPPLNGTDNGGDNVARARADSGSVSSSSSSSLEKTTSETVVLRFEEFWAAYPVKDNHQLALGIWVGIVTPANIEAVFACLARYLASDRGNRSPKNPANWLHDCSRDKWQSDWPKPMARQTTAGEDRRAEVTNGIAMLDRARRRS